MSIENPYAPPAATRSRALVSTPISAQRRRPVALGLLTASTVFAIVWAYVNQFVLASPLGPIPMFIITTAVALFSGLATKDLIFAPLSCGLPILSACAFVGTLRGWATVHYGNFLLVAIGCSLPSFLLVLLLQWRDRHHPSQNKR